MRNHSMQETQQNISRQTNYPYNRKQCNFMFRTQPQPNQKTYRQEQCQDYINNALNGMKKYGYTIIKCKANQISVKQKTMPRKVKLKFHCNKCNHKFTSIVGSFQIQFYQKRFYKLKKINLYFQIKIYKMKCKKCKSDCDPIIYESQLNAVKHSFCNLLSEIMQDFQPPQHRDSRYKLNEDVHKHEEQFCEACKLGKCHNIQKKLYQNYISQRYQRSQSSNLKEQSSEQQQEKLEQEQKYYKLQKQRKQIALKQLYQRKEQQQQQNRQLLRQRQVQRRTRQRQYKEQQIKQQIKQQKIRQNQQANQNNENIRRNEQRRKNQQIRQKTLQQQQNKQLNAQRQRQRQKQNEQIRRCNRLQLQQDNRKQQQIRKLQQQLKRQQQVKKDQQKQQYQLQKLREEYQTQYNKSLRQSQQRQEQRQREQYKRRQKQRQIDKKQIQESQALLVKISIVCVISGLYAIKKIFF